MKKMKPYDKAVLRNKKTLKEYPVMLICDEVSPKCGHPIPLFQMLDKGFDHLPVLGFSLHTGNGVCRRASTHKEHNLFYYSPNVANIYVLVSNTDAEDPTLDEILGLNV